MQEENVSITNPRAQMPTQPPSSLINLPGLHENESEMGRLSSWRPRRRRWMIAGLIILVLFVVGALIVHGLTGKPATSFQTDKVTQGNLTLTVNATGPLQSGVYNLVFNGSGGKINEIDVLVGQKVVKGQVLARLDRTLLQDAVNQAQTAVNNAQASLNAALASSGSASGQSNATISAAQTALNSAKGNQAQTEAQGQASVAAAQQALTNAENNLSEVTATANAQKQTALDTYNATGCTSSTPVPTPAPVGTGTPTPTPVSTTTSVNCPQALDNYNLAVQQANASIATAQAQVATAQAALKQAQTGATANNTAAANQVSAAESQLASAQAGAGVSSTSGESQVVAAQNQLNAALAQLKQALHNLANATLTAPHDGVITVINGTVGGMPGISSTNVATGGAFIQLVDASALQIQANVNEADIANLQDSETATFTVNAYNQQQFAATVGAIPPTGVTISNVVTYPVVLDVDPTDLNGAHLLPGMTANVTIDAVQHQNVLLLPVNAINFARLASSGNTHNGTPQLLSAQAASDALNRARQQMFKLESANPNLVTEGLVPAYVIEQRGTQTSAQPVVLGLTDGISYEVLQGLSLNDTFLVGIKS